MWKFLYSLWENRGVPTGLLESPGFPPVAGHFPTVGVDCEKYRCDWTEGPSRHVLPHFHTLYYYRYPFFLKEKQFILPVEFSHRTPFSEA